MTSEGTHELNRAGGERGALELHENGEAARETSQALAAPGDDGTLAVADDGGGGEGGDEAPAPAARRPRRPARLAMIVVIAIAVAAAAGAAASGAFGGDGGGSVAAAPSGPPATAKVKRTTLTSTETVDGNLGYGDVTTVKAPGSAGGSSGSSGGGQPSQGDGSAGSGTSGGGSSSGTVTWTPSEGDVIKRGKPVYKVDEESVPLFYGSVPFYRPLKDGVEGDDVKVLEQNLAKLGYTGFTVDDEYTSGTADAVKEWQKDLGRDETGVVQPGDAVVASGARRVSSVDASPGDQLSGTVLSWTGTERVITVDLDVQYEGLVHKGVKATVALPDDTTVDAEVTDVGSPTAPANKDSSGSGSDSSDSKTPTLPVELKVKNQHDLGSYQAAGVDVTLKSETRKNVLAVPINALVVQPGGQYSVEAVTDKGVEYVAVKTGMFADGLVEVSGSGIHEGMEVGVPK
ncbi:peptidoglycan-binding protein [Streptomyces sp. NPDC050625]|uniref:peptidoglycan-binding protein n=1 Tax=Streptomyces sp. NPDC050625 TaxID=3154629 RepID=UPI0034439583